jgi:hypothetical protein
MSETTDEPDREGEQYPDEEYGGTRLPDEKHDEPDESEASGLGRVLDSVRDIEDA